MSGTEDADLSNRRKGKAPFSAHNPIPTIQHYREEKQHRAEEAGIPSPEEERQGLKEKYQAWKEGKDESAPGESREEPAGNGQAVYPTENKNTVDEPPPPADNNDTQASLPDHLQDDGAEAVPEDSYDEDSESASDDGAAASIEDTSQTAPQHTDPKTRRKALKKARDNAPRQVTDPVTHLPVTIHDFTRRDLRAAPRNREPPRPEGDVGDEEGLGRADAAQREAHDSMEKVFPPPDFESVRAKVAQISRTALLVGLGCVIAVMGLLMLVERVYRIGERMEEVLGREFADRGLVTSILLLLFGAATGGVAIWGVRDWADHRIEDIWESEVWEAERHEGKKRARSGAPESTEWLNGLLASVWPLINPDLFISIADTLEDVMQASLPRLVRMVSVEDIGQGSEAVRILGMRWLPHGAAARSVTSDGELKKADTQKPSESDRSAPDKGKVQASDDEKDDGQKAEDSQQQPKDDTGDQNIAECMEAETGDFVNMEVAFAYRARATGAKGKFAGLRNKAKNIHLYLAFYLPGNIKLPVWVEVRGIIGTMRARMQLTPDPPFFSLCTITFLGQPKVELSCVPLIKRGLNLMDLPLISRFVQSSIDAVMAEYVAPKSLTLDLREMLAGDDFKKDTSARGILVVRVKRAFGFKEGDMGISPLKQASSDGYITVGWAKFGKPMWSSRIIAADMHPAWDETAFVLVTPQELHVDENLRVQLWDSDRTTADDDLGRIEVPLKDIMRDERGNGKMWEREDGFRALKKGEGMPGKLDWSVGYYSKTRVTEDQMKVQTVYEDVKSLDDLKKMVDEDSERKLREAKKDETAEIGQQKEQEMKSCQDEIIVSTPPPAEYPSGILSIVIHNITTLELEAINKSEVAKHESASDEQEQGEDLPSAYCEILINHQKVYKTRTKPKTSRPFYNAGTERFIRDWRTAQIHIAVRDARVHEDNALIGMVHLPLKQLFEKRSQVNEFWPLAGGVGFGRIRISMVFRAVQLQAPPNMLGWEYGTLDINPTIKGSVSDELKGCRIKARTILGRGKFYSAEDVWKTHSGKPVRLAVRKRYCSCVVFEFRAHGSLKDKSPAFAILWLKDIPDDDEKTLTLTVWKGDINKAENNVLDEYGEKAGEIEVTLTFWSGLSGYHLPLAKKDPHLGEVMEILDAANDVDEDDGVDSQNDHGGDDGSDSEGSRDTDADSTEERKKKFRESGKSGSNQSKDLEEDGKRGLKEEIRDFKEHHEQLGRRNRGLMQWKAARTAKWMIHKAVRAEQKSTGMFGRDSGDGKVETEV